MPMFGADVAALRGLARSLRRKQEEIEASRRRLASVVDHLPWAGADHDRFADEWRRIHSQALATVVSELGAASGQAEHHADRQERASRRHD